MYIYTLCIYKHLTFTFILNEKTRSSLEKAFYETSPLKGSITMRAIIDMTLKANQDFGLSPVTSLTCFHLTFAIAVA